MRVRSDCADERGETLLELVVAIAILGICVVAIGSGIALSVRMSAIHRAQATASAFLHTYAETLEGNYTACTTSSSPNYAAGLPHPPSNFSKPNAVVAVVAYWDTASASFPTASTATSSDPCPTGGDPGLQRVTLTLTSDDGYVSESLVVVLRNPT